MKLKAIKGDITILKVDAIVNAANTSLLGGGGVDGAIHRAGGSQILEEAQKLANCYTNSLKLAIKNNCKSIAFPNISTGVYNFPKEKAATIAVQTANEFLQNHDNIEEVIFVCFDDENFDLVNNELKKLDK